MLTGLGLMKGLLGFYCVLVAVFTWEGDWPRASYWLGAAIITGSVLWME